MPTDKDEEYEARLQQEEGMHDDDDAQLKIDRRKVPERDSIADLESEDGDGRHELSPEQTRVLVIQRISFLIKMIAILDWIFSIYSYVVRAWWLLFSFGWLLNPVGFYGAHTYNRRYILVFIGYLILDTIFQLAYMFATMKDYGPIAVVLSLFFACVEGYLVYYVFQFYKILPRHGWTVQNLQNKTNGVSMDSHNPDDDQS